MSSGRFNVVNRRDAVRGRKDLRAMVGGLRGSGELDLVERVVVDDGAVVVGGVEGLAGARALRLALPVLDVHAGDGDLEGLLDGRAHRELGRGRIHLEGVLPVVRGELVGLLRQTDVFENLVGVNHDWAPVARAMIFSRALLDITIFVKVQRSRVLSFEASCRVTRSRLRAARVASAVNRSSTISTWPMGAMRSITWVMTLVFVSFGAKSF